MDEKTKGCRFQLSVKTLTLRAALPWMGYLVSGELLSRSRSGGDPMTSYQESAARQLHCRGSRAR